MSQTSKEVVNQVLDTSQEEAKKDNSSVLGIPKDLLLRQKRVHRNEEFLCPRCLTRHRLQEVPRELTGGTSTGLLMYDCMGVPQVGAVEGRLIVNIDPKELPRNVRALQNINEVMLVLEKMITIADHLEDAFGEFAPNQSRRNLTFSLGMLRRIRYIQQECVNYAERFDPLQSPQFIRAAGSLDFDTFLKIFGIPKQFLIEQPKIKEGDTIKCQRCTEEHEVYIQPIHLPTPCDIYWFRCLGMEMVAGLGGVAGQGGYLTAHMGMFLTEEAWSLSVQAEMSALFAPMTNVCNHEEQRYRDEGLIPLLEDEHQVPFSLGVLRRIRFMLEQMEAWQDRYSNASDASNWVEKENEEYLVDVLRSLAAKKGSANV